MAISFSTSTHRVGVFVTGYLRGTNPGQAKYPRENLLGVLQDICTGRRPSSYSSNSINALCKHSLQSEPNELQNIHTTVTAILQVNPG